MTHDHDLVLRPTPAQTEAALNPPPGRTGADLVVETLAGLGATTVFGGAPGYAFPAALGAAVADPTQPVLAVSDGDGALYSTAELATAREHGLDVTWLIVVDDGPAPPDFAALAESFGVPGVRTSAGALEQDLAKALASPGPSVVVLPAALRGFAAAQPG
ncbi:hypothetical protein GCM10010129_12990 [Streptomyces fumigatiscleroticus]|nr:hypothetical protein GCM10010129_12990 [Streptomyces fumigatiscleroticus]